MVSDFFDGAHDLRAAFDRRMRSTRSEEIDDGQRFVWDYWHTTGGQATHFRTPAEGFFPAILIFGFMQRLRAWGLDTLGCWDTTGPWLSYYIDGCGLQLHTDVHIGPWSYALSLSHWDERPFEGGETLVMRPETLDYWRRFDPGRVLEPDDILERIPARFNQLTVFDPRLPHGVATVHGTRDPLRSRVVIQGWFRRPRLIVSSQAPSQRAAVETLASRLQATARAFTSLAGTLTLRIEWDEAGAVTGAQPLTDTLIAVGHEPSSGHAEIIAIMETEAAAGILAGAFEPGWAIIPIVVPERPTDDGCADHASTGGR